MTSPPPTTASAASSTSFRKIEEWHVVLGDTQSHYRTTKATKLLKQIRDDYETKKKKDGAIINSNQSHGASKSWMIPRRRCSSVKKQEWIPQAIAEFKSQVQAMFENTFKQDAAATSSRNDEDDEIGTVLWKIKPASQKHIVKDTTSSCLYGYPEDTKPLYGKAKCDDASLVFFFESRHSPTLEKELQIRQKALERLQKNADNHSDFSRPPMNDLLVEYAEQLAFFQARIEKAEKGNVVAKALLDTLKLNTFKDIEKCLKEHHSSVEPTKPLSDANNNYGGNPPPPSDQHQHLPQQIVTETPVLEEPSLPPLPVDVTSPLKRPRSDELHNVGDEEDFETAIRWWFDCNLHAVPAAAPDSNQFCNTSITASSGSSIQNSQGLLPKKVVSSSSCFGKDGDVTDLERRLQSLVLDNEDSINTSNQRAISMMQQGVHSCEINKNRKATNILRQGIFQLSVHVPEIYEDFMGMAEGPNNRCLFPANSLVTLELPAIEHYQLGSPNELSSAGIDEKAFALNVEKSIGAGTNGTTLLAQVMVVLVFNMAISNHREAVQEGNPRRLRLARTFYEYCDIILQGYSYSDGENEPPVGDDGRAGGEDHLFLKALRTNLRHVNCLLWDEAYRKQTVFKNSEGLDRYISATQGFVLASAA